MKIIKHLIFCSLCSISLLSFGQQNHQIISLDGKININISTGNTLAALANYNVAYKETLIVKKGNIGLVFKDGIKAEGWRILSAKERTHNSSWNAVCGEKSHIADNYKSLTLTYGNKDRSNAKIIIDFRVYNEGIAFKYRLTNKKELTLNVEKTDFGFAQNDTAWVTKTAQGIFEKKPINDIKDASERPMTIKRNDSLYYALGEAGLIDFARMKLIKQGDETLTSILSSDVSQKNLTTPWRYILFGDSPGDLLEKNFLLLNLNKPNQIKNTSWIVPGKVIRENSFTTSGSFEVIDFAAKHQIKYVLFDAGWYGKEDADTSNALQVMIDPARSKGPLDLQKVIDYASTKNIGIILYVNRKALERQLDDILPLYKKWGVKGIKFGFVQVGTQKWTSWLHDAIRKCAKYEMLVDVHDEYRPTGYERTYPNLMTQEGIRGDEESPTNEVILTTLFTRMIAGAGDQTNAYFTKRIEKMGSHSSQMAKAICIYSPLQFIYWYDRPAGQNNDPKKEGVINEIPDLNFYDKLPTVWDSTKVLESSIGNYATIARKNENSWYIGSLTDKERNTKLDFKFLDPGKQYIATIYTDDDTSISLTKVKIETQTINSNSVLSFLIKKNNGLAMQIIPVN